MATITINLQIAAFAPLSGVQLTATPDSPNVELPSIGSPTKVKITNLGSVAAFLALGDSTVAAETSTGVAVLPGVSVDLEIGSATYLSAATESSSAVLHVNTGN